MVLSFVYLLRSNGDEPFYQKLLFAIFAALVTPLILFAIFWSPLFILMVVWAGLDEFYRKLRQK